MSFPIFNVRILTFTPFFIVPHEIENLASWLFASLFILIGGTEKGGEIDCHCSFASHQALDAETTEASGHYPILCAFHDQDFPFLVLTND